MIHATAIVHPDAQIGVDVEIGPYSIVGAHVQIGDRTRVGPHVVLEGHLRLGCDNRVFAFAALGGEPQDMKYHGEPTRLEIGDRNTIREYCTMHVGTAQDEGVTRLGNDNWIMGYVHIAHDCRIGDHTVFASNAQIAGHCHVGDWAILGGMTGVHQFVKIGAHAMTGGGTILFQDVPPYVMASGNPAKAYGINSEGLRRRGFSEEAIAAVRSAYKTLYRSGIGLADAIVALKQAQREQPSLDILVDFLQQAKRGILR